GERADLTGVDFEGATFDGNPLGAALAGAFLAGRGLGGVALADAARAADADATRLETSVALLGAIASRLAAAQREVEELDASVATADRRQAELTEQAAAARATADGADQRAADCRAALRAELGDAGDLDAALATARGLAAALAAAADTLAEATRTAATATEETARALAAVSAAGFTGVGAAQAARREAGWRKRADASIREHEGAVEAVAVALADPELDVPLEPPAPVEPARAEVEAAREAHSRAVGALDVARATVTALAGLCPQLAAALDALAPLAARAAEAKQVADLANASTTANQYKMTLSAFVLAARLEEVAEAASQRLVTMTAGRYSLMHTDARKGAGKAGLGLLACDSWTGQDRDTATLSGGETFLASLALALGLADVVTAEAAGTRMEALFVDEGFGTLDEDTLEEVMTVLDGLREGGRMVGIVSHVSELRQRVPAQVHVRKGHHGSRVVVRPG
ncbi:MAG TPA: SbcC/MukB-like Walker B domain-containing protein, partial [Trebonia sp.]|nr:SbcC/MukB-like Walker B domain-containing protein [Trebonia sp.]